MQPDECSETGNGGRNGRGRFARRAGTNRPMRRTDSGAPVRSAFAGTPAYATAILLSPPPHRLALLGECRDAFARVRRCRDIAEAVGGSGYRLAVAVIVGMHECGAPNAYHLRRFPADRLRQFPCRGKRVAGRSDTADETQRDGFFRIEGAPGKKQLESAMAAGDARQVGEMDRREDAGVGLPVSEGRAPARDILVA